MGDLDDLQPVFPADEVAAVEVDDAALLEAALDGLVALAKDRSDELTRLRGRIASLREKNRSTTGLAADLQGRLDTASASPVRAMLVGMSEQRPWLMTARKVYSRCARLLRTRP